MFSRAVTGSLTTSLESWVGQDDGLGQCDAPACWLCMLPMASRFLPHSPPPISTVLFHDIDTRLSRQPSCLNHDVNWGYPVGSALTWSALPRSLLEMQNLRPLHRLTKSESAFSQDAPGFSCTLWSEMHCCILVCRLL